MFVLRLFGGLSLERSSAPVPPGALQRRRLTLLALLAVAGERGLSRERIQAYLWPESPPDRARHALDQLLYATRRDLGSDAIISSAGDVRLNPEVVRADVWKFDEAVRAGRWEEVAGLYVGPLLDGVHLADTVELERWLDAERMGREQDHHRALETLARAAAGRGDPAEAARWWRRRAAAEPLSAPVALQLMRALAAAGDRAGAVQHARVFRQLVRSTLEVEPDPAVAALAAELAEPAGAISEEIDSPGRIGAVPEVEPAAATPAPAMPAPPRAPPRASHRLFRAGAMLGTLGALVTGLLVSVRPHEASSLAARGVAETRARGDPATRTADPQARVLYRRARTAWDRRNRPGLEEAVVLFRLATERDPGFAAAYSGLAKSYAMLGYFGFGPADAMFPKARAAALRALAIDSADGDAYAALGQALAWEHAWAESERAYRRALQVAPDNPTVHQWYALMLAYMGRAREAALHTGHASRLDPLSVQINNMHGVMLYHTGDLEGALRQFERTVEAEPDSAWVRQNPWVLDNYGSVAAAAGRYDQAIRLIERALDVMPGHPRPLLDLAYAYAQAGKPASARAAFARVDTSHPHYAMYQGLMHSQLGELDDAFAWLDRVDEWPLPSLVGLTNSPRHAALRADPRYQKIRQRLALPAR